MTTETISKTPWTMYAPRFRAKVSDQIIIQHLRTKTISPFHSMTVPAGFRPRCSKDEVTVGIQHLAFSAEGFRLSCYMLVSRQNCWYRTLRTSSRHPCPFRHKEQHHKETRTSAQHVRPAPQPTLERSSKRFFMFRKIASRSSALVT